MSHQWADDDVVFCGDTLSSHRWTVTLPNGSCTTWAICRVGTSEPPVYRLTRIGENMETITMMAAELGHLHSRLGLPDRLKLFKRPEGK